MNKCQLAFEKLKNIFISQSVLSMVDTTKLLQIELDASEYAIDTVLSMLQDNGKWHSVPLECLRKGLVGYKE